MSMLDDLSLGELEACIELIEAWFREDTEIEEERYSDQTYATPEAFLSDIEGHRRQREAMRKLLKAMEEERDRRTREADAGPV